MAFWLLARACLRDDRWSLVIGASLPAALTLYGSLAGPFALGHVLDALILPGLVVSVGAILFSSWARKVGASLLPIVFVVAFLVRAGGLFHPLYYHPDLRSHANLTEIVSEAGFDFWAQPSHYIAEQGVWTQGAMGKTYAFPFSPVFHSLFLPLDLDFFTLIVAMKLAACFLSALEVLIVFYLGCRLGGTEIGLWGAALTAFSPAAFSRLSFALLAAVFAHFLDTLVLASLFPGKSGGKPHLWLTLALLTSALASYPGSLVSFGIFFPVFGLLLVVRMGPGLRRDGLALLAGSAGVAVIVLAVVYREFVGVFLSELVPLFLAGESEGGGVSLGGTISLLIRRYWIFHGGVYIPLIAGGALVWFLRRPSPFLSRLLLAWAFTFVALIFLRASAPDLFSKVKEILWVAPLISLAGGTALAWARRSLPRGRWLTAAYYSLVVYYGISFYVSSYPGSLVSFGIFFPVFGLLLVVRMGPGLRRDGLALLAGSAGVAVIVLAVVYREFVGVFLSELVPLFLAGESEGGGVSLGGTISLLIRRYWIFHGGVYIPLIAGGALVWFLRRPSPFLSRLLLAWAFTFVALIFLRASAPDLFSKVKEILWVAPLISLAGGTALAWARRSLPRGRWLTAAYYSLAVYYGISFYVSSIAEKFALAR